MIKFNDELDARICYEDLSGECYLKEKELVVICELPDNSGVWVDNEDGDRIWVKIRDLYVSQKTFDDIQKLRKNYF